MTCRAHGEVPAFVSEFDTACSRCVSEGQVSLATTHVLDHNGNSIGTVTLEFDTVTGSVTLPDNTHNRAVRLHLGLPCTAPPPYTC